MRKNPYWLVIALIIILGIYVRTTHLVDRFFYNHDHDLSAWIAKDMLIDQHPRLIGQLTSAPGIFIGPIFYYLLTPFYVFWNYDPIGTLSFPVILAIISSFSAFFIGIKTFGKKTGIVFGIFYTLSYGIVNTEREVVPTAPVTLWSLWFLYGFHLFNTGQVKKALKLLAILAGLIWHLSLGLVLVYPILLYPVIKNKIKFSLKDLLVPGIFFIILSAPLIIFEVRHGFSQTQALLNSNQPSNQNYLSKTQKVGSYIVRNVNWLFWQKPDSLSWNILPGVLVMGWLWLLLKKKISIYETAVYVSWICLYWLFFSYNKIAISEYYLNGQNIVWFIVAAKIINQINSHKNLFKIIGISIVVAFVAHNVYLQNVFEFSGSPHYMHKKQLIDHVIQDAINRAYPCISVSYITGPGYNLGYRYLFWLKNLPVNLPASGAPVYSIVFPISIVDKIDTSFGPIGLIYPEYNNYTPTQIENACRGRNDLLTEPMFGFTK